jgi:hypothetical protein
LPPDAFCPQPRHAWRDVPPQLHLEPAEL